MSDPADPRASKVDAFRSLHVPGSPFVIPNPWDAGSARILAGLGFPALATTSSGFALTLGRQDYGVTRARALAHCRELANTVDVPVSADLENGFGASPEEAAETIHRAAQTGLAGGSIEDSTGDPERLVFDETLAIERVAAAAEAARAVPGGFVLTARAESLLYGGTDLDKIIVRLQAFARAGADVVYAPGLRDMRAVRAVCAALDKPVNILAFAELRQLPLTAFAEAGAARVSTGGHLARTAYATLIGFADVLRGSTLDAHDDPTASDALAAIRRYLG